MSGGSYNYLYGQVQEMGESLSYSKDLVERAFGKHLILVAKAMHDVEWVHSGDYGPGDSHKAIQEVLREPAHRLKLSMMIELLHETIEEANQILDLSTEEFERQKTLEATRGTDR